MSHTNSWSSGTSALAPGLRDRVPHLLRDLVIAQRPALPWALLAVLIASALLGMGAYVLSVTGQPLSVLVRDANAIAGQPNYFGALEYAGILLMSGAGWIAVFSAFLCRGQAARFLLLGGLLSLLLAADDLYMIHESAWRFGMTEQVVFGFYGLLLVLLVFTSLGHFLKTPFVLLAMAMLLFAMSIVLDAGGHAPFALLAGAEDCLELSGICFWSVYFVKCSRDSLLAQRTGAL